MKSVQIRRFFWFVFSRIRTEYGEIWSISPYSVRMREYTDQKKLRIWTLFTQCLYQRPESLIGYIKIVSYQFFIVFIVWIKFSGCEIIPKSRFKTPELFIYLFSYIFIYSFIYLFIFEILEIQIMIHYQESEAAIHKYWKNSCWIFFQNSQENTRSRISF